MLERNFLLWISTLSWANQVTVAIIMVIGASLAAMCVLWLADYLIIDLMDLFSAELRHSLYLPWYIINVIVMGGFMVLASYVGLALLKWSAMIVTGRYLG